MRSAALIVAAAVLSSLTTFVALVYTETSVTETSVLGDAPLPLRSLSSSTELPTSPPSQAAKCDPPSHAAKCDLCARNWLFIVSTGRAGSTTLLNMLNEIPSFTIAGENGGFAGHLFRLKSDTARAEETIRTHLPRNSSEIRRNAWSRWNVSDQLGLRCAMQAYALAFLGVSAESLSPHTVIGWKEIRYDSVQALNFMRDTFPCAKFILNTRQDLRAQAASGFKTGFTRGHVTPWGHRQGLEARTSLMARWAEQLPRNTTFALPVEKFSLQKYNEMLAFLGVSGCEFVRVLHSNFKSFVPDASTGPVVRCSAQHHVTRFGEAFTSWPPAVERPVDSTGVGDAGHTPRFAHATWRTSKGRGRLDIDPTNKGFGPEAN